MRNKLEQAFDLTIKSRTGDSKDSGHKYIVEKDGQTIGKWETLAQAKAHYKRMQNSNFKELTWKQV